MSTQDKLNYLLTNDEKVVAVGKFHWYRFFSSYVVIGLGVLMFLPSSIGALMMRKGPDVSGVMVTVMLSAAIMIGGFYSYLTVKSEIVCITNKKIIYGKGLLSKTFIEIQMDKYESLVWKIGPVFFGFFGIDVGTIVFGGSGGTKSAANFVLNFKEIRDEIQSHAAALK